MVVPPCSAGTLFLDEIWQWWIYAIISTSTTQYISACSPPPQFHSHHHPFPALFPLSSRQAIFRVFRYGQIRPVHVYVAEHPLNPVHRQYIPNTHPVHTRYASIYRPGIHPLHPRYTPITHAHLIYTRYICTHIYTLPIQPYSYSFCTTRHSFTIYIHYVIIMICYT